MACKDLTETIVLLNTDPDALAEWTAAAGDNDATKQFQKDWKICAKAMKQLSSDVYVGDSDKDIIDAVKDKKKGATVYAIIRRY